jgi:WD40 repeat protein/predicted Ser/Thr protein kinase
VIPTQFGGACGACLLATLDETGELDPATSDLPRAWSLPGYENVTELARGGTAIVYRAQQIEPPREVAIKVLLPMWTDRGGLRERFRLEVQTLARLDHPAILPVFEFGQKDGLPWFSMRLATGGTLASRLANYQGKWREIAELMASIAEAVAHAHEHGVLHRDLKPGNILFGEENRVFVADFGLARVLTSSSDVTVTAAVMGTPAYMAPEVIERGVGNATTAGDVWGLGAVLYELLAQARAFPAETIPETIRQITGDEPAALPSVPRGLDAIARFALRKNPAKRYTSARALAADLRAWLRGDALVARPFTPAERLAFSVRRHPVVATLVVGGVAAAIASVVIGFREASLRRSEATARQRAETAELATSAQLRAALVAQALALRSSGLEGQRERALAALAQASQVRPGIDLRNAAIAALALPDIVRGPRLPLHNENESRNVFDGAHHRGLFESYEGPLSIRDVETGKELAKLARPDVGIHGLPVFSSDGSMVAARFADKSLRVWKVLDGTLLLDLPNHPFPVPPNFIRYGRDVVFARDNRWLATGEPEGGMVFHALPDGRELGRWTSSVKPTSSALSPDGLRMALGDGRGKEFKLYLIEVPTGKLLSERLLDQPPYGLAWSADGAFLAIGGLDEIVVSDPNTAQILRRVGGLDAAPLFDVWFSDNGEEVFSFSNLAHLHVWDVRRGISLVKTDDPTYVASDVAPHTGGRRLFKVVDNVQGQDLIFSPSAVLRMPAPALGTKPSPVGWNASSLAWSPDGRLLAVGHFSQMTLRDALTGQIVAEQARTDTNDESSVAFYPLNGRLWLYVLSKAAGLGRQEVFRDATGSVTLGPRESLDAESGFWQLAVHPASGRLATVSNVRGEVRLHDATTGAVQHRWPVEQAWSIAYVGQGAGLLVGYSSAKPEQMGRPLVLLNSDTGKPDRTFSESGGSSVVASADGQTALTVADKKATFLWHTKDWSRGPAIPEDLQNSSWTYALSPDGRLLVVRSQSTVVQLLSTATGEILAELTAPTKPGIIVNLCFNPSGTTLAAVTSSGHLALWDIAALRRELGKIGLDWIDAR